MVEGVEDRASLVLNDSDDLKSRTATVNSFSMTGQAPAKIEYSVVGALTIDSPPGSFGFLAPGDTFNIQSTAALLVNDLGQQLGTTTTTINSYGPDTINVGDINGLNMSGADKNNSSLTLDDEVDASIHRGAQS